MEMKRVYHVTHNVGTVKYFLSYHDGKSKHKDGSDFYDCSCFSNQKKLKAKIKQLEMAGYTKE